VRRFYPVALAGCLVLVYGVLVIGSLRESLGTVLFACLATYVIDALMLRTRHVRLLGGLDLVDTGLSWRFVVRQFLVAVFLLRTGDLSRTALTVVLLCVIAHHLAVGLYEGLALMVRRRRLRRIETRNLPVPGTYLPPPLPRWLLADDARIVLHTDLLFMAGLAWAFLSGSYRIIPPAAVLMVLAALVLPAGLVPQLLALLRLPGNEARLAAGQKAVHDLRPEVILHFSGGVSAVYQVNMWLETMEQLDQQVLVLLRERRYLEELAPTTAPVLCLPFTSDLMTFSWPSAQVALYVANVGKNIHLLRVPTLKSAFIGHGDSDKAASFNPFTKVYDEVWVAGAAGRDRYLRAQVGVREDQIVFVGRPQLDRIQEAVPRPEGAPFTVLYAPTWEGWTEEPDASSLLPMGREIVRALLGTAGVRVIYKPHPLTGTVNQALSRVSDDIVGMLRVAGPSHLAVLGTERSLYECFDESDALVSDISSVISDYLRSEKPYLVTNGADLPAEEFRAQNPSVGGAYLVGPKAVGLLEGLQLARTTDPLRSRRREVRTYLLGDPNVDAMTLFRKAVADLSARALTRNTAVGRSREPALIDEHVETPRTSPHPANELQRHQVPG
jgi:CDP-Glycerol:Poly(glycerophosphate) glycerophosphotransferase